MDIVTDRLILTPWKLEYSKDLYKYAKDDKIGPPAGFPPHTSEENSEFIIENILKKDNSFAIKLKNTNEVIGSIGLDIGKESKLSNSDFEGEIGYWVGVPHWGNGYIPEAVKAIMNYAFNSLKLNKLYCGYFKGNEKSKRVQEKCGFTPSHVIEKVECKLLNEIRTEYVTSITKEKFNKLKSI